MFHRIFSYPIVKAHLPDVTKIVDQLKNEFSAVDMPHLRDSAIRIYDATFAEKAAAIERERQQLAVLQSVSKAANTGAMHHFGLAVMRGSAHELHGHHFRRFFRTDE